MNPSVRVDARIAAALILAASAGASAQSAYTITDLGTLHGVPSAMHITNSGVVVGIAIDGAANFRAVRFGATAHDLGPIAGFTQSVAFAAQDDGTACVGGYTLGGLSYGGAAVGVTTEALGAILPHAVNTSGVVVGLSKVTTSDGLLVDRACVVSGGVLSVLPTLGGISNAALDVNDGGWIVGASLTSANTRPHACVWIGGAAHDLDVLGMPAGGVAMSEARSINASGVAVGVSTLADGRLHACAWAVSAGGVVTGRTDLGALGSGQSFAYAINGAGDIVGTSDARAFLVPAGTGVILDLNTLVPLGAGWRLDMASDINDSGQIVGWGMHDGWPATFLLTPNSACGLADIASVGGTAEAPGTPDGQLTVDDIIVFINLFSDATGCPGAAPCSRADVSDVGGTPDGPDGQLTVDDIIAFFNSFSNGC